MAKDVEKEKKERVKNASQSELNLEKLLKVEYMVKLLGQLLNYGQFGLKATTWKIWVNKSGS